MRQSVEFLVSGKATMLKALSRRKQCDLKSVIQTESLFPFGDQYPLSYYRYGLVTNSAQNTMCCEEDILLVIPRLQI